jgi:hypothetical protein
MLGQIMAAAALGAGVYLLGARYIGRDFCARYALHRSRPWSISEFPEGAIGRVVGAARPVGRPLTAPLSGRACVCYVASIMHGDYQVVRESRGVPFVIEDATGVAIVDPSHAELALDFAPVGDPDLSASILTYREAIIGVGDMVYVSGAGVRAPDRGEPYRAAWPAALRLTAPPRLRCRIGRAG